MVECDESYCIEGGPYLVVGVRGICYHESYCDERVVMIIYGFQIFLVTSVPGGRVMLLHSIWAGSTFIWAPPPLHGFLG